MDIDEVYTNLSWMRDVRSPSGTTKKELDDYTEIFKGHGRVTNPKRMLVYGRPGIGKSTFCQKLAVDWANERSETLKKFDLLLLVKLRDLCGIQGVPAILEASKLFAADGPISSDVLYDYVLQNQDRVLLVLDGYDEYIGGKTSLIRGIWEGDQLRDCHVIMTTREMEGEELVKFSHVQCEIKGFLKKTQVKAFAARYFTDPNETEEFVSYLNKGKLWDIAEIPLLLLMLCLIWKNRHNKELPTSQLELHERFVETLLFQMNIKDSADAPVSSIEDKSILNDHKDELNAIGQLALDALLENNLYVVLNDENVKSGSLTDKMIRSGLFQFSKLASADPNRSIFFLHKSIQEFLAAWYIINESCQLEEGKMACFTSIDSFFKVLQLRRVLQFMCEWSEEGAKAVFSLLRLIGEKEDLTQCCLHKTPSLDDLSPVQRLFRDVTLECLLSCSASVKQNLYPVLLSCAGGVVFVSYLNSSKVAAQQLLRSDSSLNYVFFGGSNLPISILADLKACVVTHSGQRLESSRFIQKYLTSELEPEHFFVKKEGDQLYLKFSVIFRKFSAKYLEMLRELTSPLPRSSPQKKEYAGGLSDDHLNCLSVIKSVRFYSTEISKDSLVLSHLLSSVPFPQEVLILPLGMGLFDAQVVKDVISHINLTDNLCDLVLGKFNMKAEDLAGSLHRAPNLHKLDLSDCCLYAGVSCLAENLRHVPRLSVLKLSRVGIGYDECLSLATSLEHLPKLTVLDLSFNLLGHGISYLSQQLIELPHLEHLNLERTKMGEAEATVLAEVLSLDLFKKMRTIRLGGNPLSGAVSVLVQDLSGLPDLKEMNLEDVVMSKEEVDAVSAAQLGNVVRTSYHVS